MHEWGNLKRCGVELEANCLKNVPILVELDWSDQDQILGAQKQPLTYVFIERVSRDSTMPCPWDPKAALEICHL